MPTGPKDTLMLEPKRRKANADSEDADKEGKKDLRNKSSIGKADSRKRFIAGDRSRPSTFEVYHQNEVRVAALVGYTDMASLRTFLLTPSFLKYYLLFDADWSKGMRVIRAFEQIRDVWLKGNMRDAFSTSWDDVDRYRPSTPRDETYGQLSIEDKEQTDRYLAQILILMVEEYTQAASVVVSKKEQDKFSKKLMLLKPKISSMPDISGRLVHLPQIKCEPPAGQTAQESDLEAYNRALNLLRHMVHTTNNAWSGRYEKGTWDRSSAIDPALIPDFMHYEPIVVAPKYTVAEALKAGNFSEKKIILSWSLLRKDDEAREYLKNNKDLPLPPLTGMPGFGDPRILNEVRYRDSLRAQYRCHENGLQLAAVKMSFPLLKSKRKDEEWDDECEEYDVFSSDWEEICKALQKEYPDSNEVHEQSKLCLLDKRSDEPLMERTYLYRRWSSC